jgi:protease IV
MAAPERSEKPMTSQDIEVVFEREKLRRSRRRWRVFGILAVLVALAGLAGWDYEWDKHSDHIARISINGLITGDQRTLNLVSSLATAEKVKAVIVAIDSPGGTTSGSEALYEALRKVAEKKPVVAVMDSVAASGGYIAAIATDHIVARGNTITGSIGVIFAFPEVSKLLDTLGIKMEEIKSGELKAAPSPYKPVTDKVRAVSNEMVQDAFDWFVGLVSDRRNMTPERARFLADGRVYTGRQALKAGLIDTLGGETEALSWLTDTKNINKDLSVVEWRAKRPLDTSGLGFSATGMVLRALGMDWLETTVERAKLDGLLVLWHP